MPAIHFLTCLDRLEAKKKFKPVICDMSESQLRIALLAIIDGIDLERAIDIALSYK